METRGKSPKRFQVIHFVFFTTSDEEVLLSSKRHVNVSIVILLQSDNTSTLLCIHPTALWTLTTEWEME